MSFYLTLNGDYSSIEENRELFVSEFNAAFPPISITDIGPGIVLTLTGEVEILTETVHRIDVNGLDLDSFRKMSVTESKCSVFEYNVSPCSNFGGKLNPDLYCKDITCTSEDASICCVITSPSMAPTFGDEELSASNSNDDTIIGIDHDQLNVILLIAVGLLMCCLFYVCFARRQDSAPPMVIAALPSESEDNLYEDEGVTKSEDTSRPTMHPFETYQPTLHTTAGGGLILEV